MGTTPVFEVALRVAAGSDLFHEGNQTKVVASDRAAVSATVSRA